jgi:hypothetical protein
MAKILQTLPTQVRKGRDEQYPWADWFDGQVRLLEYGIDYEAETDSMKSCAYAAARRHGVKIALRTVGDDLALQAIQATSPLV